VTNVMYNTLNYDFASRFPNETIGSPLRLRRRHAGASGGPPPHVGLSINGATPQTRARLRQ
jgi:hypothetical protein